MGDTKNTDLARIKQEIQEEVERHREELIELSLKIHANPELGWHEEKASGWLTDYLEENGFNVERGICDLPTAFRASYGQGKPTVAFLAEYDALPDVGHGCGHNIIGVAAVGAGIAAKNAADQLGGTILVIGTPAEELLGGKVVMVAKGAFNDVDAAMIIHPRGKSSPAGIRMSATISLDVEFWGKAAHAAAMPWDGISALEALILAINNINGWRLHIKDGSRVHGVITDGGKAANVVPEHAAGSFMVRSPNDAALDELSERVLNCFKAAELATGARLEYRWGMRCDAPRHNPALIQLWTENMKALGREVKGIIDGGGSTDMGNVSVVVPSLLPFIAISPEPLPAHSREWAAAAASETGMLTMLDSARGLAMTAADVISQPDTLARIKEEFRDKGA